MCASAFTLTGKSDCFSNTTAINTLAGAICAPVWVVSFFQKSTFSDHLAKILKPARAPAPAEKVEMYLFPVPVDFDLLVWTNVSVINKISHELNYSKPILELVD
eukprot:7570696-Ditylum_brightwellii.AAC.2